MRERTRSANAAPRSRPIPRHRWTDATASIWTWPDCTAPIARLVADGTQLTGIALADGVIVPADALFTQPPQRQTELVRTLDFALDDGYVKVDAMKPETSTPGIYASGDLTTRGQAAILAAASGMQAAAAINVDLALNEHTIH